MKVKMYQYAKCSTCRVAVKWLETRGYEVERIPIDEQPPSAEELAEMARISGFELKRFFNVAGQVYRSMNLKDRLPSMSEEEQFALLASNGMLIKRPIVTDGKRVTVGYNEAEYAEVWGK